MISEKNATIWYNKNCNMKKQAITHNIIGAFSNFAFLFLTSIVLLPYYFKFVSATDYGIWLGGISFLSLVSVLEANISLILTQLLGEKWTNKKADEFSKYFTAALFFGIAISCLIVIFTYFIKDSLCNWVSNEKQINKIISDSFFYYSIYLSLTIISGYVNSISQVLLKTLLPPIFNIIASIFGILYTFWAIPSQGILAIATGNVVKAFIYSSMVTIYAFIILRKANIPIIFEFRYLSKLMRNIGLPFISKVGMTLAVSIQNFIIATTISATATTIFDITKKLPSIAQMLINMVAVSTFTSFSLYYSEQKNKKDKHEYTDHYFSLIRIILLFSLAGIFIIGQDFITFWVGIDKFGGNILLALLCICALSDQLRMILSQQYYAIGKFNLTSLTDTIFAITFMIIALFLIPIFGLKGIVLAGIFANTVYFGICFYLEKKYNIDMIKHIINRSLFFDLLIILFASAIVKFIYESYRGNLFVGVSTIFIAIVILVTTFYIKEKSLFNFLILKFGKTSKSR